MRTQAVADAGSVAVVVAVLQALHPSEVGVQRTGCGALFQALVSIVHCGAAYAQAVLADADGAVAVHPPMPPCFASKTSVELTYLCTVSSPCPEPVLFKHVDFACCLR